MMSDYALDLKCKRQRSCIEKTGEISIQLHETICKNQELEHYQLQNCPKLKFTPKLLILKSKSCLLQKHFRPLQLL